MSRHNNMVVKKLWNRDDNIEDILSFAEDQLKSESIYKKTFFSVLSSELRHGNDEENTNLLLNMLKTLMDKTDSDLFSVGSPLNVYVFYLTDNSLEERLAVSIHKISFSWSVSLGLVLFMPWLTNTTLQLFNRYFGSESYLETSISIPVSDVLLFGGGFFLLERIGFVPKAASNFVRPVYNKIHSFFIDPVAESISSISDSLKKRLLNLGSK